jgi:hypothetical protein
MMSFSMWLKASARMMAKVADCAACLPAVVSDKSKLPEGIEIRFERLSRIAGTVHGFRRLALPILQTAATMRLCATPPL